MATLTVGQGQQYSTIASAVAASHDGDTVAVQAGTYLNDFVRINDNITIVGVGGMANIVATVAPPNGKAIFDIYGNATIENIGFSGAKVADHNGAGIKQEAGSLIVDGCNFTHDQMGILTANTATMSLTVLNTVFGGQLNDPGGYLAHQLYAGNIGHLDVENSLFLGSTQGHQIKSRAAVSVIENNIIDDQLGTTSRDIDLPNGGVATIDGNTIVKGVNAPNTQVITYGAEGVTWSTNSLTVTNNIIDNHLASHGIGVYNLDANIVAHIDNNQFFHLPTIAQGPNEQTGNTILTVEPVVHDTLPTSTTTAPSPDGPVIAHPDAVATPHEARHFALPDRGGTATGVAAPSVIVANGAHQTLIGHGGDDMFQIGNNADASVSELGHGVSTVLTSAPAYTLAAGIDDLTAVSGTGAQSLTGNAGNNYITGNAGNDVIGGGAGNDTIAVGGGANSLTGGAGSDLFVFASVADHGNAITDFTLGQDELDLIGVIKSAGYHGTDPVKDHVLQLVQHGLDTAVVVDPHGNGDAAAHAVVTLDNVLATSLKAGHDFIWH